MGWAPASLMVQLGLGSAWPFRKQGHFCLGPWPYFMDIVAVILIYSGCLAWLLALRAGGYSFGNHPSPQKGGLYLLRRHLGTSLAV